MKISVPDLMRGAHGDGYAHEYDGWMALFRLLAFTPTLVECEGVPSCWTPFIKYLGHVVLSVKPVEGWDFEQLDWTKAFDEAHDKRRVVEVAATCRPELVHALYCLDTEWPKSRVKVEKRREFPVTCNGSFFRPEVQEYRARLEEFVPSKRAAVLVPCAAEKPYPSPLHRAVLQRVDERFHVIVCTGVLGLVPFELWDEMPLYDSGVPNLERVSETVAWYFTKHQYDDVLVYSDFYAYAVHNGFVRTHAHHDGKYPAVKYLLGHYYRDTYENLTLPEHLRTLERAVLETPKR